jgi:hypothetical protein
VVATAGTPLHGVAVTEIIRRVVHLSCRKCLYHL